MDVAEVTDVVDVTGRCGSYGHYGRCRSYGHYGHYELCRCYGHYGRYCPTYGLSNLKRHWFLWFSTFLLGGRGLRKMVNNFLFQTLYTFPDTGHGRLLVDNWRLRCHLWSRAWQIDGYKGINITGIKTRKPSWNGDQISVPISADQVITIVQTLLKKRNPAGTVLSLNQSWTDVICSCLNQSWTNPEPILPDVCP